MIKRKAYAKINLSLDVLRRREDGYHEVRMIMQTVNIFDELTFELNPNSNDIVLKFENLAPNIDLGPVEKNLIYRAAKLVLQANHREDTGVIISLKKNIPVAAGMAGGSTDAAAVFHGLNELLALGMKLDDMCSLGVRIGADVPYCIMGGTALSEGIGEILTPIKEAPKCILVVAKPDINVSTKFVYENLHANELKYHPDVNGMLEAISNQDLTKMTSNLGNVLETVTTKEYPIIDEIKGVMKSEGALNALMSGSGPTVFGIFEPENKKMAQAAANKIEELGLAKQVFVTTFV